MTTQEFNTALESANTVSEVSMLRSLVSAPIFINKCKIKIEKLAQKEGYNIIEVSMNNLKRITSKTDCGDWFEAVIPTTNRTFKGYSNVKGYVNSKIGTNYSQKACIIIKQA